MTIGQRGTADAGNVPVQREHIDLTEHEWRNTLSAVKAEGIEEWGPYYTSVLAAIQEGYMDNNLQIIARHLRQRYEHLMDPSKPGPGVRCTDSREAATSGSAYQPGVTRLLGRDWKLQPTQRHIGEDGAIKRTEFRARGHAWSKSDFIGSYVNIAWPKRQTSNIYVVLKTMRTKFMAKLVYSNDPSAEIGTEYAFMFDYNTHMFEE